MPTSVLARGRCATRDGDYRPFVLATLAGASDTRPMRLVLGHVRRVLLGGAVGLAFAGLVACPSAQFPKGPPPLYEDPPAPSWLDAGAPADAAAIPSS